MPVKPRLLSIDALRAFSIIGVMVIHSLALFLGPSLNNTIWNYLEFVVIPFVACSGYVTWLSFVSGNKQRHIVDWYVKRLFRLYIPFAAYMVIYAGLAYTLPTIVSGRGIILAPKFFLTSLLLSGGADVGWLPLLFLQLSILTPILIWMTRDSKRYYIGQGLLGLLALGMVFIPIPTTYSRVFAWLPWSFIYLLGMKVAMLEQNNKLRLAKVALASVGSAGLWIMLQYILHAKGMLLTFTLHKYPPDLFYLSYGVAVTGALLWSIKQLEIFLRPVESFITFVSQKSYGMFLTHLIVLDFLTTSFKGITVIPTILGSVVLTFTIVWLWGLVGSKKVS